ncbi:hypothetical protein FQR65_LT20073 [Abscondita terminalis]|nr:hypothetical protein FQR65_LT20073 [Abscondita terminalis]
MPLSRDDQQVHPASDHALAGKRMAGWLWVLKSEQFCSSSKNAAVLDGRPESRMAQQPKRSHAWPPESAEVREHTTVRGAPVTDRKNHPVSALKRPLLKS